MKRILILSVCMLLVLSGRMKAADFTVRAEIDSLAMFIGDQANLKIKISQGTEERIISPILSDSIVAGLEIVEQPLSDTVVKEDGTLDVFINYKITSFDSALYFIPPMPFVCGEDTQYTNPLTIKVVDVPVDTTQMAITDIKNVYEPPFNWPLFIRVVLYVLIGLLCGWLIYYLVRKYRKKDVVAEPKEVVDPRKAHEIALEELDKLKEAKLWQQNKVKEYYTQLTEIIRQYLKRRYDIDALESTTDEVLAEVKALHLSEDKACVLTDLKNVLGLADLVKFAKYVPIEHDNTHSFSLAVKIVNVTKEDETIVTEEQNGAEVKENER